MTCGNQVLTSKLADSPLVTRAGSVLAQKVAQVSVRSELDDDVEGTVLRAAAEQVENIDVLADHLHHFHFGDEVHEFRVRVALCR